MDESDDPTRALDDFARRMRPGAPSREPPDLSDLARKIAPGTASAAARARGGRLRSGERWSADDVVDVPLVEVARPARGDAVPPEVELPTVGAPDASEAAGFVASLAAATRAAAARVEADASRDGAPWQPEIDMLQQRRAANPRLLAACQPGCWIGAVREVIDSRTEIATSAGGPIVQTYAPHRLLLAWAPQHESGAWPGRWPAQVRLSAVSPDAAADVLLAQLPDDAVLWLMPTTHDLDWALAAEIVLHHDSALRPFQIDALRAFVAAEREATFGRLNTDYRQVAAGATVARRVTR